MTSIYEYKCSLTYTLPAVHSSLSLHIRLCLVAQEPRLRLVPRPGVDSTDKLLVLGRLGGDTDPVASTESLELGPRLGPSA